jgi:hypothetical protein
MTKLSVLPTETPANGLAENYTHTTATGHHDQANAKAKSFIKCWPLTVSEQVYTSSSQ